MHLQIYIYLRVYISPVITGDEESFRTRSIFFFSVLRANEILSNLRSQVSPLSLIFRPWMGEASRGKKIRRFPFIIAYYSKRVFICMYVTYVFDNWFSSRYYLTSLSFVLYLYYNTASSCGEIVPTD